MSHQTINAKSVFERRQSGAPAQLIDVRTSVEFREIHAEGAESVPLDRLDPTAVMAARNGAGDEPLYIMCRTGNRAGKACEKFLAAGFANAINVEGGVEAWEQAGLPVRRGKKAMSLERQVRIAAGSLVLLGIVLGFLLHPIFYVLAVFVGAGLVFAGVTDTCGMGMLLAKMPWNQVAPVETAKDQACCST